MQGSTDNNIWVLFANGEGSRVSLTLHPGKSDESRPADAYVVTGGGLSRSARRAAEIVYNWLEQSGKNPDRFVAGFDVQNADSSMTGDSSGLAFAVSLAAMFLNKSGVIVAATGEILEGQFPGPVGKVGGINEKAEAAVELLPHGGVFLYPVDNDIELSDLVREQCMSKDLILHPVQSVAEALDLLFTTPAGREEKAQETSLLTGNKLKQVAFGIVGVVLVVCLGLWLAVSYQRPVDENGGTESVATGVTEISPVPQTVISEFEEELAPPEEKNQLQLEPVHERGLHDQGFD